MLENPHEVGISSIREIAEAANVKPNTFVRMARSCGFDGYEDFRAPFREEIRKGQASFPTVPAGCSRYRAAARWAGFLPTWRKAPSAISRRHSPAPIPTPSRQRADAIVEAHQVYVLGVGMNHTLARNFAYLADMALDNVRAIPRAGSNAFDDIARAGPGDVLLAMTFKPYRADVVDAVALAREAGATIIGISDSAASPIVAGTGTASWCIPKRRNSSHRWSRRWPCWKR